VERLDALAATRPLATALESALRLVRESEKPRKEVYVFTDLAQAAWSTDAMREVTKELKELTDVGIYVIDVGATDPTDSGLTNLRLSSDVLSKSAPLRVAVDLVRAGPAADCTVELYLLDRQTGNSDLRAQQQFALAPGESQRAEFSLLGLPPGI